MLYEQIKYAEAVRLFYRLRGRQTSTVSSDLVRQLGHRAYSSQFYAMKRRLKADGVLDRGGRFIDSMPNACVAELPLIVGKETRKKLGEEVSFSVFLAAVLSPSQSIKGLSASLGFDRSSIYRVASALKRAGLVKLGSEKGLSARGSAVGWLLDYLEVCKTYVNVTGDISVLFRAVPACIDGPRAYYALHRESGMPVGRADMVILTPEPYRAYWEGISRDAKYFREYQRRVDVASPNALPRVVWVEGLPFNVRAKAPG